MAIAPPTAEEKKLMDMYKMAAGDNDYRGKLTTVVRDLATSGVVGRFDIARVADMLDRVEKEDFIGARLQGYEQILQSLQQPTLWAIGAGRDPQAGLEDAMLTGKRVWTEYMKLRE